MEALLASETWSATTFENFLFLMDCLIIHMLEGMEVGDFDAEIFLVIAPEDLVLLEELWVEILTDLAVLGTMIILAIEVM